MLFIYSGQMLTFFAGVTNTEHLPICIRHQFGHQTVISRKLCQVKEAPDVIKRQSLTPCQLYLRLYFEGCWGTCLQHCIRGHCFLNVQPDKQSWQRKNWIQVHNLPEDTVNIYSDFFTHMRAGFLFDSVAAKEGIALNIPFYSHQPVMEAWTIITSYMY